MMSTYSATDLNELAMKIILHAGDCRNRISEAFQAAKDNKGAAKTKALLQQARKEITKAHKLQTDVIQSTILQEEQTITMLFIHAQDTLMTIHSELFIAEQILSLFDQKDSAQ